VAAWDPVLEDDRTIEGTDPIGRRVGRHVEARIPNGAAPMCFSSIPEAWQDQLSAGPHANSYCTAGASSQVGTGCCIGLR